MLAALVNHEVRRKDKESSSSSTTTKTLTVRGISSNHQNGKGDVGKSKTGNHKLRKISVLSAKKKDIERLIIQGSRRRKDKNQMQISHMRIMILILTLQCYLSITSTIFLFKKI